MANSLQIRCKSIAVGAIRQMNPADRNAAGYYGRVVNE